MTAEPTELMTPKEVAELTKLGEQTIVNWRCQHKGPPFIRLGRLIRYEREAVTEWLRENTVTPKGSK